MREALGFACRGAPAPKESPRTGARKGLESMANGSGTGPIVGATVPVCRRTPSSSRAKAPPPS